MPPSSDSLSTISLPFGADNHTHATGRRSGSITRSAHHGIPPAAYNQAPQRYSTLMAYAQTSDAISHMPIPPTSFENLPRSHKRVIRRHRLLFRVLILTFNIFLIALTAAIVLGAAKAHQVGQNGAKCAAIIVGVLGFSGLVGSAAVMWLIRTGRKERARLEKRWAEEERVKEERVLRERRSEGQLRRIIKERERSLSRSRSRGRDRVPTSALRAAEMLSSSTRTPTPISKLGKADTGAQHLSKKMRSPWPSPRNVSSYVDDDSDDDDDTDKSKEDEHRYDSSLRVYGDEIKEHRVHTKDGKTQARQKVRDSAFTHFQDLDPLEVEDEDKGKADTPSTPNTAILDDNKVHSEMSLPLQHTETTSSPIPEFGYTFLDTSSTCINSSPPTEHPDPLPSTAPNDHPPRLPPIAQLPFTHDHTTIRPPPPLHNPQPNNHTNTRPPLRIPGWNNAHLGSLQSDENFQAMLDTADDIGSEDEYERRLRRQKSSEMVRRWASEVDAGGEKAERGRRLREVVGRGAERVKGRKRVWREARRRTRFMFSFRLRREFFGGFDQVG
ncbi:hypothetical protein BDR22DRAFT_963211 [Usnea florida]